MLVFAYKSIMEFVAVHRDAKDALDVWYEKVERATWRKFSDIKKDFPSVSHVGNNNYVFNIRHNRYRLVAKVRIINQYVIIRFIGTHKEYDRIKDIQNI